MKELLLPCERYLWTTGMANFCNTLFGQVKDKSKRWAFVICGEFADKYHQKSEFCTNKILNTQTYIPIFTLYFSVEVTCESHSDQMTLHLTFPPSPLWHLPMVAFFVVVVQHNRPPSTRAKRSNAFLKFQTTIVCGGATRGTPGVRHTSLIAAPPSSRPSAVSPPPIRRCSSVTSSPLVGERANSSHLLPLQH